MGHAGAQSRGAMKIDKEVMITASLDEVWSFLTNERTLASVWGQQVSADFRPNGVVRFPQQQIEQKIKCFRPPKQLSLCLQNESVCLTTTYCLTTRGRRTMLTVTVSGWDMMEQERARQELPRVSLEWEKRLGLIKRSVEAIRRSSVGRRAE